MFEVTGSSHNRIVGYMLFQIVKQIDHELFSFTCVNCLDTHYTSCNPLQKNYFENLYVLFANVLSVSKTYCVVSYYVQYLLGNAVLNWNVTLIQGNALLTLFRDSIYNLIIELPTNNIHVHIKVYVYHIIDCHATHTSTTRKSGFRSFSF